MSRVELLEKVKKQVEDKGTIRFNYYRDNCMCAVGYVLAECGIDMTDFESDKDLNGDPISKLADRDTEIFMSIIGQGLSVGNLITLQKANDDNENSDERREAVITAIDELIEDFTEADSVE